MNKFRPKGETTPEFKILQEKLLKINVPKSDLNDLKSFIDHDDIDYIDKKLGKKVSNWVGKMANKNSTGEWKTEEKDAVKILAEAIIVYYRF
jgi:hypothetical protein